MLPVELTSEWQLCDLVKGDARVAFSVERDPLVPSTRVELSEVGLTALKLGLQSAGLDHVRQALAAPRGVSKTAYPWGDKASHEFANYGADECCDGLVEGADQWLNTAPVGSFKTNAFTLHARQCLGMDAGLRA